jgi:hypothetical protein
MKEYCIKLSSDQLNAVAQGIAKLPYEVAAPLFDSIRKQVSEQESEEVKAE